MERSLIISSDGHAMALMQDYRPYLPARRQSMISHRTIYKFIELGTFCGVAKQE